ncbi:hypothetical protein P3L10_032627 [Capsicum annuum]
MVKALLSFVIVERKGDIIACTTLVPYFEEKYGEVAAIAVSSDYRGQGQRDKLLGMVTLFSYQNHLFFHIEGI